MSYLKRTMHKIHTYLQHINWAQIGAKCLYFTHLQLFLTLISLPILIAWGLPLSLLSPLGNLIFGPALTIFLLLSSLIFFCELVHIPNTLFAWLLDHVTSIWTWCLAGDHRSMLMGFGRPPLGILIALPFVACAIVHYRPTHARKKATVWLGVLLITMCASFKIKDHLYSGLTKIAKERGEITVIKHHNELIVIDPGYLGSTVSASSWVSYTLIPEITKQTGSLAIDHLIVLQLNHATLDALTCLCTKITVKKLYLPWWSGILRGKGWQQYKKLSAALSLTNSKRIPLKDNSTITIGNSDQPLLSIKPTGKQLTYTTITYPVYCVDGTIDNHSFTIYAAKHTKAKRIS